MKSSSRYRPLGQVTRGKTARNRLRRVDIYLLLTESSLLRRKYAQANRAFYVDLGYGAEPFTTLESAERLRTANPHLPVLGVEIEPDRVAAARPFEDDQTFFRLGGFNIPLESGESVRLIRAFNVLRQYEEDQVLDAHLMMGKSLLPGGLVIEGTSDPFGRVWVANLLRKEEAEPGRVFHEGVLFSTNFHLGFDPSIFQPVLPKNYIHRMVEGEEIFLFLEAWKAAARDMIAIRSFGLRQWFAASAARLSESGYYIDLRPQLLRRGFLLWRFYPPREICQS